MSESHMEEMEKDADGKDERMKNTEKMTDKDETLGENGNNDDKMKSEKRTEDVSNYLAPSDATVEGDVDTDVKEASTVKTVLEASEENKGVSASEAENDKTLAGEETKPCSSNGKAVSGESVAPELHKVKYLKVTVCCQSHVVFLCN